MPELGPNADDNGYVMAAEAKMGRRFNRIGGGLLLIAVLVAVAWVTRERVVACWHSSSYALCAVQNRWTGTLDMRAWIANTRGEFISTEVPDSGYSVP